LNWSISVACSNGQADYQLDQQMTPAENEHHDNFLRSFTVNELAIRAYVRRLVPTRSDADDVMQEVSVVLWKKFGEFRKDGNFRAWAFGVARFAALAWRRDKARDRLVLDENVVAKLAVETIDHEAHLAKQREALERCMQRFERPQRDLLMAAYEPDSRIQDVASNSGRSIPGFYQWLHRVRRMLLDCIQRSLSQQTASE
jgi:RNA polymerase sigma-70 factor (ECF subfamily)